MDSDEMEKRIDELINQLSSLKLVAGDNISLTQSQEGLTISAVASGFTSKLKRWLLRFHDNIGKPKLIPGHNIHFEEGPSQITINADVPAQRNVAKAPIQNADDYPFKMEIKSDGTLLVHGYNEDAKRYFRNYVTLGLTRLEVAEQSFDSIGSDTWIYLEITHSGSYSAELKSDTSFPDQTATKYVIPIAFVKTKDGKASEICQMQYGPIEGSGRIF